MSVHARSAAKPLRLGTASFAVLLLVACSSSPAPNDPGADGSGDGGADTDAAGSGSGGTGTGASGSGGSSGSAGASGTGGSGATGGSGGSSSNAGSLPIDPSCGVPSTTQPPDTLSCTGLYADIVAKTLADDIRPFAPAYHLWSDGAAKQRWIYLPGGTQIDNSNPDAWVLPDGTKMFKEFQWNGRRVETRLFAKVAGRWLKTSYHWNADETEATRFDGGEVDVDGDTYYIPSAKECDQCHKGRADRALGFEQVLLSLDGAEGLTMQVLVDEDRLTDPPAGSTFALGDDGTGKAVAALGYLHVNCGVSCHNANPGSEGYTSDLRLRLPPEALDGGSPAGFEPLTTTVGVPAQTPRWSDRTRIVAGSPGDSLLYELISVRDPNNPKDQMPPIASRIVDTQGIGAVEAWITALPP